MGDLVARTWRKEKLNAQDYFLGCLWSSEPLLGRADTLLRSHLLTTTVRSKFCSQQIRSQVPGMCWGPTARPGPAVPWLVSRKAQSWLGVKSQSGYGIVLLVAL